MSTSNLNATKALTILKTIAAIKVKALEKTNNLGVFVRVKGVMKMTHVKIPIPDVRTEKIKDQRSALAFTF